jgi:hypothetical protein
MKAYGSGCIDPHFLDLDTNWKLVVNFTPRPLYPRGKSSPVPIGYVVGWTSEPIWTILEKRKFLTLPGLELRSPYSKATSCLVTQELPNILWNTKVQHRVINRSPLVPSLSQKNPIRTIPSYFSKIYFVIIVLWVLLAVQPKSCMHSVGPHMCYITLSLI